MSDQQEEFKFCVQERDADCERQFRRYLSRLPEGYERGQWAPVHCGTPDCHGVWHVELCQGRLYKAPSDVICVECKSRRKRARDEEEAGQAGGDKKRQRAEGDKHVYAVLRSVDEQGRVIKAHIAFDCQESFDAHEDTDFDCLIGSFCDYVNKHGDHDDSFVDDAIEVEELYERADMLHEPIYVNADTNS